VKQVSVMIVIVAAAAVAVLVVIAFVAGRDSAGRGRLLRRIALVLTLGYAVLGGVFIAGETFTDPGGWAAIGMVAAWALPLAGLALAAWYRPAASTVVLTVATAIAVLLSSWFVVAPDAWRSFENHTGPVRALVTFVIAVALGLLGWHRPVPAGVLLLVLGLGPPLLAGVAGGVPLSAASSTGAVSVPALTVGGLYLLSATVSTHHTRQPQPQR
jgi:hypothetical protein